VKVVNTQVPGLSKAWLEAALFLDEVYDDEYKGDYTTTKLTAPTRYVLLHKRHDAELQEDVQNRAASIAGSGVHEVLRMASQHYGHKLCEQRFTIEFAGKEIGIKADRVDPIQYTEPLEYKLIDFKCCKTWAVMLGDKEEWIWQGRINAYALKQIGINVTIAQDEAMFKDWSLGNLEKAKSSGQHDYPRTAIGIIPIPLVDDEEVEDYMQKRIGLLEDYKDMPDDDLPLCSHDERWAKADTFAVMKKGAQRATKVCTTRSEADQYMRQKGYSDNVYSIVFRPGVSTRCEHYCAANRFCNQYNEMKKGEF